MLAIQPSAKLSAAMKSSWPHLDADTVMKRVDVLKNNPNLIDQGALGLCGEATFFHHILQRDPLGFVAFAKLMFMDAVGFVGNFKIQPDTGMFNLTDADYGAIVAARGTTYPPIPPQADWMVLSALRDSENEILDYQGSPSENFADGSDFLELFQWHQKSGLYTSVTMDVNTDLYHASANVIKDASTHIALRIKEAMIQPGDAYHIISLESPMTVNLQNSTVSFDYWSWAYPSPLTLTLTYTQFTDNYLGAIIAKF
jgi:hypothetical protein